MANVEMQVAVSRRRKSEILLIAQSAKQLAAAHYFKVTIF